ncbi:hypothetical protein EDB92DRAFT_1360871 [Lactarius akahatsu]|uniref:Uncharacterized protein n=1 Tax=Lactarius akahatsu TaxID=416441 RepID=A0AAD4L9G3_9AGAM|nr:hypothetical protein EDB92DRAFT_1360871 [Lactarius akahatsu]
MMLTLVTNTSIPLLSTFPTPRLPPIRHICSFMSADSYGPSSSSIILSTRRTPLGITTLSPRRTSTGAKPRFILEYFSFSGVFVFASCPSTTTQSLWPSPSLATPSVFPIYYLLFVTPLSPSPSRSTPIPVPFSHFISFALTTPNHTFPPSPSRFDHRYQAFSVCINYLFLPEWICASPTPSPSVPARVRLDR